MADDNRLRSFQSSDPSRRDAVPASERSRANDPLAELARLIGQGDPFAEQVPNTTRDASPRQHVPTTPATPDWRNRPPPYALMRAQAAAPATRYQPASPATPYQPARSAPADSYTDVRRYTDDDHGSATEPQFSDPSYQDNGAYAAAGQDGHDDRYYDDGAAAEQYDNTVYEDPPRAGRRGALITALTLIGCATLGTAGAYGYRTYYAAPSSAPAPVIVADKSPTKACLRPMRSRAKQSAIASARRPPPNESCHVKSNRSFSSHRRPWPHRRSCLLPTHLQVPRRSADHRDSHRRHLPRHQPHHPQLQRPRHQVSRSACAPSPSGRMGPTSVHAR